MKAKVTAKIETITPDIARRYLERNRFNRRIVKKAIADYARQMRDGEWALTGDTIRFDSDGNLLDGQHRLTAVIESGATIESVVVRGLDRSVFPKIDRGKLRSLATDMDMMGCANYTNVSAVIKGVCALRLNDYKLREESRYRFGCAQSPKKMSDAEYLEVYKSDPDGFQELVKKVRSMTKGIKFSVAPSVIGANWYYLMNDLGYDQDTCTTFFCGVFNLQTCNVPLLESLRMRFIMDTMSQSNKMLESYKYALLVNVWNKYVTGKGNNTNLPQIDVKVKYSYVRKEEIR